VAGTVEVIAASASAVNQMAFDSASSRMFTRFWNGTVWSAWSEIWRTTGVAESLAANGWQRLPSGLIEQWVQGVSNASGVLSLTLPTAFPNQILGGMACEAQPAGWTSTSTTCWAFDAPSSNLATAVARVRAISGSGGPGLGVSISGIIRVWGR
jgi:hypothetical protein